MQTAISRIEETPGTDNNCTPTTRDGGKYTHKDVQTARFYSSPSFSKVISVHI